MKQIKSIVLSRFEKNRIYRKDLKEKCRDLSSKQFNDGIKELENKGVISKYQTLVDWVDYEVTLYVCNYEIIGSEGDIVYLQDKEKEEY